MKSERETHAEIFAGYMIEAMHRTRLRQADIARLTGLSRTIISQLVGKKPNSVTGKLMLPKRETVDRIARAFGDAPMTARRAAGYSEPGADDTIEDGTVEDERAILASQSAEVILEFIGMEPDLRTKTLEVVKILSGKSERMADDVDIDSLPIPSNANVKQVMRDDILALLGDTGAADLDISPSRVVKRSKEKKTDRTNGRDK